MVPARGKDDDEPTAAALMARGREQKGWMSWRELVSVRAVLSRFAAVVRLVGTSLGEVAWDWRFVTIYCQ